MAVATRKRTRNKLPTVRADRTPPIMPRADSEGHYPAAETLLAIIARQIADRRHSAGLSQAELAKRAGVRQETISRLESGKHAPTVRTIEKIDRALAQAKA